MPTTSAVAAPAATVREHVAAELRALGLVPRETPGGLTAEIGGSGAREWADCPRILVYDRTAHVTRSDWAAPYARTGTVTIAILRPEGEDRTRVSATARFAATYTDRYRNLPIAGPCASTGALERRLLLAAAGAAGGAAAGAAAARDH